VAAVGKDGAVVEVGADVVTLAVVQFFDPPHMHSLR
jgi:hypothetical protein